MSMTDMPSTSPNAVVARVGAVESLSGHLEGLPSALPLPLSPNSRGGIARARQQGERCSNEARTAAISIISSDGELRVLHAHLPKGFHFGVSPKVS